MSFGFETSWRVRFNEVDLQGVVHHTQIVAYLEIARVECWRALGISYRQMRQDGYEFIVNNVNVEYKRPLVFDEIIKVKVGLKTLARASFVLAYEILKETGEKAIAAETGLVCSRVGSGKPSALPSDYVSRLKSVSSRSC